MKTNKKILLTTSLFLGASAVVIPTTFSLTSCSNEPTIDYTQPLQPNYMNDLSIMLPDNAVRKVDSNSPGVQNVVKYLGWQDADVNSMTYGARYYLGFDKSTNEVCAFLDAFSPIRTKGFIDTYWGMNKNANEVLTIPNEIKLPNGYYINNTNKNTVKVKGLIRPTNIVDFSQVPGAKEIDKYLNLYASVEYEYRPDDLINSSSGIYIKQKNIDLTNTNVEYISSSLLCPQYKDDTNKDDSIKLSLKGPSKLKFIDFNSRIMMNVYSSQFKTLDITIDLSMCNQLKDLNGFFYLARIDKNVVNVSKLILPNSVERIDAEISCRGVLNINLDNVKYISKEAFTFSVEFPNNTVNLSPDTLYYRHIDHRNPGSFLNEKLIINGGKPLN